MARTLTRTAGIRTSGTHIITGIRIGTSKVQTDTTVPSDVVFWRIMTVSTGMTIGKYELSADSKRAAVHDKQAKKYFDAGQYDDAIMEFQASYRLDKKPVTLFKIASAYYKNTDYTAAVEYYQKYLDATPDGPLAQEAIDFSADAKQQLADRAAKKAAQDEAARREAERKAAEAERERKKLAATGHVKQAEAYEKAGAWSSAGDEYIAAAKVADDPSYLLLAAERFRKQPDNTKARAALLAYLEKVPVGPDSEKIRGDVATLTRESRAISARSPSRISR